MSRLMNDSLQRPGRVGTPDATLIILVGGMSRRMGRNKALLPIQGRPMFRHIMAQVEPHFDEVLISGDCAEATGISKVTVVPDRIPNQGPLRGLASSLNVTRHDLNFVVACDMPEIDILQVLEMLAMAEGYDVVVQRDALGRWEPLFGVYRRSVLPVAEEILARGGRRIIEVYPRLHVRAIEPDGGSPLVNLNDEVEYRQYIDKAQERERLSR